MVVVARRIVVVGAFTVVRATVVVARAVDPTVGAGLDARPAVAVAVEVAGTDATEDDGLLTVVATGSGTGLAGQVNGAGGVVVDSTGDFRATAPVVAEGSPAAAAASGRAGSADGSADGSTEAPSGTDDVAEIVVGTDGPEVTDASDGFITAKISARTCAPSSRQFR